LFSNPELTSPLPSLSLFLLSFQDGIVNVSAKDKATNKDQSMTIASSSGLSDSQIEKMVKDAEAFAESDKAKRELIEMAVGSDSTCTDTQKCTFPLFVSSLDPSTHR